MTKQGIIAKGLAGICIAILPFMSGCASKLSQPEQQTTLRAIPMSVCTADDGYIAAALFEEKEGIILGYSGIPKRRTALIAAALIQSEINDGDEEKIELRGNYDKEIFEFNYVKANGREIKF